MISYFIFPLALLGLIVGSFLNVVILRHNTGKGINGRSGCFSCGKTLRWYELIPVLSYVFQKGKCTGCKSHVSLQYPLVELLTAFLFGIAAYIETDPIVLTLTLIAFSFLVVIVVYDLKHTIIPDRFSFFFGLTALIRLFVIEGNALFHFPGILDLLAGPLIALPFFLIWLVSRGRWMGFGDSKLGLGIGWFLGFINAVSAVCLAFWIGAAISLVIIGVTKLREHFGKKNHSLSLKSEIPFAPFLALGLLVAYIIHIDFLHLDILLSLW